METVEMNQTEHNKFVKITVEQFELNKLDSKQSPAQNWKGTFLCSSFCYFLTNFFVYGFKGKVHKISLHISFNINSEAATRGVLWKKVFLKISQNLQKNTCVRSSFLIKLQAWRHRFFPVNFARFLRATFLQNTFEWLILWFISDTIKVFPVIKHFEKLFQTRIH